MDMIIQTFNKHLTATTSAGYCCTDSGQTLYKKRPAGSHVGQKGTKHHAAQHGRNRCARGTAAGNRARPEDGRGQRAEIALDGDVTVNDTTVIRADVEADDGVVHVIDRVLIPAA